MNPTSPRELIIGIAGPITTKWAVCAYNAARTMQRRSGPIGKTVRFDERFSSFLDANVIICQLCLSYAIQIIFIFSIQNNYGAGFVERQT
jgi:hypothetical protein